MKPVRVVIVGAAGQARETAWAIDEMNRARRTMEVVGFVVSDLSKLGANDSRDRVLGDYGWLESHQGEIDALALGIGTPGIRLRVAEELGRSFPRLEWPTIVHPSAVMDERSCSLGRGVLVAAGVVATVNVQVGDFAMLNFGSTIGHEAVLGPGCVVNPGANVSGGVTLGPGVLVGAGAVILQYLTVGARARVGAGAVVTKNVEPSSTVVGAPARPVRPE